MSLRIAIVTDIHRGPNTGNVFGDKALELLEGFTREAAALSPDLMVDLGDRLTEIEATRDRANLIEVAEILRRLPCPRHHLVGNHDILPKLEQEMILEANLSSHAFEMNGWQLVFLETYDGTGAGEVREETVAWLEGTLRASDRPAVVFSHQPLHDQPMTGNPYFEREYADMAHAKNAALVRGVLERINAERPDKVRLCINGHAHWNDVRMVGGIPYVTVLSLSESVLTGGQPSKSWAWLELGETIRLKIHGLAPLDLEFASSQRGAVPVGARR